MAETNRDLAEAAKRDTASMKTIAVMTMAFLPGTFLRGAVLGAAAAVGRRARRRGAVLGLLGLHAARHGLRVPHLARPELRRWLPDRRRRVPAEEDCECGQGWVAGCVIDWRGYSQNYAISCDWGAGMITARCARCVRMYA
ncbi:hypothetical protein F5Y09DRAFT_144236 [Xylaria sp. FL1042]|nr:hypothetical protein F5Y09DRAFT_144236 [Xylaria sp. FL1042]